MPDQNQDKDKDKDQAAAIEPPNPAASAAVQEVATGTVVHDLRKPYTFNGQEYTSVTLELRSLTGKDLAMLQANWTALGFFSMQPETDSDFCILVAAHACGQIPEFFDGLPAPDYTAIATMVTVFLQTANISAGASDEATALPIELDLDGLTGRDLSQIKSAWVRGGGRAGLPATDLSYCALVAARAAGVPLDKVQALPAPQYVRLVREVSNFLQS